MSFWYLPAKEPQKHALIGTREWSSCNFKIVFKEAIAREVEDYWYFFMMIEEINTSQIKNISDNSGNWEFTPQLCLLRFAKKRIRKKR